MELREMVFNDLDQVVVLENELFASPWTKENFIYELCENEFSNNYVLVEDNKIIGYIGFWITFDICQITTLGIAKEYQGRGLSCILMDKCIEVAKQNECFNITLEVRVSNIVAQKLYEKYGFTNAAVRKNYYSDNGEDAYLMLKILG